MCPSCMSRHLPYPGDRIKVVVSDSTLHEFFAPTGYTGRAYEGDTTHVDYVTIENAFIHELLHAFRLDFELLQHNKPLDVVLVAGYADLLRGHSRDFIYDGFREFTNSVIGIGEKHHPETKNTVAISSLMYPPKIAWFRDDGPEPYNYHNQKEKIHWLNYKIDQLNHTNSVPKYPGFHTYGVRKDTTSIVNTYGQEDRLKTKDHRWGHWVETARREKMPLRVERRFKMGLALNNYFTVRT